eukprot:6572114-Lingulodinium_polyedra.AAC.1
MVDAGRSTSANAGKITHKRTMWRKANENTIYGIRVDERKDNKSRVDKSKLQKSTMKENRVNESRVDKIRIVERREYNRNTHCNRTPGKNGRRQQHINHTRVD